MGLELNIWQVTPIQLNKLKFSDEAIEDFLSACYCVESDENDKHRVSYFDESEILGDGIGLEKYGI